MKSLIIALVAFPLMSAVAMADTTDGAALETANVQTATGDADVDRAAARPAALGLAKLAPAGVADVDTNGDGKISFAELLRHDLKSDF
ncbi:MAG: hypothetical protein AAGA06_12015 [Pseudomonadota bacterium]